MHLDELRAVTAYAITCAEPARTRFEQHRPADPRPRQAIAAARAFAAGGPRTKAIRDGAWAAQRAYREARDAGQHAASEAARAAAAAASAAYLHPIARATQVWHILGAAAYAAHAAELDGAPAPPAPAPSPTVIAVLKRYPPAPAGRGRAGELLRDLDRRLRG
ncbi:putative immunity protein [Nocardia harenae]|uniref:putative immunity protein n=1 Tax=Nocardia harenae TaxID=358707 RepID=UPI000835BAE9|nr:exonuclease SbcC [Nocardia harenae]